MFNLSGGSIQMRYQNKFPRLYVPVCHYPYSTKDKQNHLDIPSGPDKQETHKS